MIRAHERIQRERLRKAEPPCRRQRLEDAAHGVFHDPRRHALVGDAEPFRAPRVDGAPGQHQVEGRRRAGEPRQPLHAAPARHDPQHHLGQAETRSGLVDDHAIPAGEGQLESAPEAEAADERDRRILDGGEPLEAVPSALDQRDRPRLRFDLSELVDVRAGDEAVRLARRDDEPARRVAVEEVERLVELGEHRGAERVGRRSGAIEREPREAVGVAREGPVLHRVRAFSLSTLVRRASRRPVRRRCRSRPCRAGRRCASAR